MEKQHLNQPRWRSSWNLFCACLQVFNQWKLNPTMFRKKCDIIIASKPKTFNIISIRPLFLSYSNTFFLGRKGHFAENKKTQAILEQKPTKRYVNENLKQRTKRKQCRDHSYDRSYHAIERARKTYRIHCRASIAFLLLILTIDSGVSNCIQTCAF